MVWSQPRLGAIAERIRQGPDRDPGNNHLREPQLTPSRADAWRPPRKERPWP